MNLLKKLLGSAAIVLLCLAFSVASNGYCDESLADGIYAKMLQAKAKFYFALNTRKFLLLSVTL